MPGFVNNACESKPRGVWTPKSLTATLQAILHGRWGVGPASEHQEILFALALLIRVERYGLVVILIDNAI